MFSNRLPTQSRPPFTELKYSCPAHSCGRDCGSRGTSPIDGKAERVDAASRGRSHGFFNRPPMSRILTGLALSCALLFARLAQTQAQSVTTTGDIPYAKSLTRGGFKTWTMSQIRQNVDYTVNPGGGTVMEKDSRSRSQCLGYSSPEVEKRTFTGTLDMTGTVLPAPIAILVDDIATLNVTEDLPAGIAGPPGLIATYEVKGTALWNPKSYKEFDRPLPPGRKYNLHLAYQNTANLTQQYNGQIDVDGVSVYVCLLPIEISVPSSISTSMGVDSSAPKPTVSYKTATEVNIATWENSFEHANPERLVRWWVTNDMDHVRVRIPRPDKIGQGPIKVTIETTNPSSLSEFNDPANEVELTESTTEPGIFENVFLLVSDDVDDNFDGRDETLKDYTHKIAVGGELIIKYEGSEISRLKVKEKGRMKLRPLVLWYHGWFSGYPAVQTSEVENDVKDIRKRFAQAGIAVDWDGGAWGIDVNNVTGASDSFRDDGMQTLNEAGPTTDERSLSSYITSTYPSIGSKDIVMVYSKRLYAPGGWGTGLIGYDQKAYTLIPTFAASKGIRPMVVTTAQRDLHTMAHETLHMVLDDVHPPGHGKHDTEFLFWRRLWSGGIPGLGGGDANAYTDRKRMSKSEQDYVVPDVQKSPLVQP